MHYTADNPLEKLQGSIERVTFHSESSGFCVQRIKVRGHRELGGACVTGIVKRQPLCDYSAKFV
jgi:hypothetical protein